MKEQCTSSDAKKPAGRRNGDGPKSALRTVLAGGAAALLLAACSSAATGGSTPTSSGAKGNLILGVFNPFSGPDAAFGPLMMSGCVPAASLVNNAGGVLGHKLTCLPVDTRGDPADAVPAAGALITSHGSSLVAVLGPSSDEAAATVPIFNSAKIPMFTDAGDAEFDRSTFTYLWRLIPADTAGGVAETAWAQQKGFTRAALVYDTSSAVTGSPPGIELGWQALGHKFVFKTELTPSQPSYETEVAALIAAKPQVIFFETGAPTAATFLGELQSLHGLLPIIGPEVLLEPSWVSAVSGAIGAKTVSSDISIVEAAVSTSSPAWPTFHESLVKYEPSSAAAGGTDPFVIQNYDGVNLTALAMLETKSTNPAVFNSVILSLTRQTPGATAVYSFAQGKQELAAGKHIYYVGAGGPIVLNQWHNTGGSYTVTTGGSSPKAIGAVSSAAVAALISAKAGG